MKDAEATLLAIPGVTEAQVFAKALVHCEFPMADDTMMELQCAQAQIEYETGWKVEMTVSGRASKEAQANLDQRLMDITRHHLFAKEGE